MKSELDKISVWIRKASGMDGLDRRQIINLLFKQKRNECIKWYHYLSLDFYTDYVFETKPASLLNFVCRMKGHPNGSWYYNPTGLEPDDHCKDCGEAIG